MAAACGGQTRSYQPKCRRTLRRRYNTALSSNPGSSMHSSKSNILAVNQWLSGRIIGQESLLQRLLMSLICGGHLLVEGAPGLAKTRAIKELATAIDGDFHRIQFTPDLLPSDITGTEIYRPEDGSFKFQQGPVFHNLLLADEVNRAPAKVQSALLEAMAEGQISIGRETYALPALFMVMATQNPIEQEGTYPLPEAQLDRFLMQVNVGYPDRAAELAILNLVRSETAAGEQTEPAQGATPPTKLTQADIFAARRALVDMHMAEPVERYIVELTMASRNPAGELAGQLEYGASPRGTIALDLCARALAWLQDRDFVTPDDVQNVALDVLRHRLILSFEAQAQGMTTDQAVHALLNQVATP